MTRSRRLAILLFLIFVAGFQAKAQKISVPVCRDIKLSASYLSDIGGGRGSGFEFTLSNESRHTIKLREPVPSSSHWYASVKEKWLWRASNGAGGSLMDATRENGRMMVFKMRSDPASTAYLTLEAHQKKTWIEPAKENPVLEYKPSCQKCSYPGERQYRVVFAYAYLPSDASEGNLLSCGIRSAPVPMPPKW